MPLEPAHAEPLADVGLDPELWRLTSSHVADRAGMRAWVDAALRESAAGTALPFATSLAADGTVVGSTRLGSYAPAHRRVEIGWTWVAPAWQRSPVNTEAKLLMLAHAFDTLGCHRVELKTDALNLRSRRAIARLGATEEGVLRRHMITDRGRVRDTVYFSVIAEEWPAVRDRLERRLAEGAGGA